MNDVVEFFKRNKVKGFFVLLAFILLTLLLIAFAGFWVGIFSIFFVYFLLCTYVFSNLNPRPWEINIIFLLYLSVSVVLVLGFAAVSLANNSLFGFPDKPSFFLKYWDHIYFSAAMFTSLGFSQYQPATLETQFFAIAQSLLGGAHAVTFVSVILMHSNWKQQADCLPTLGTDSVVKQRLSLLEQIPRLASMLKLVVGLLLLILMALLVVVLK